MAVDWESFAGRSRAGLRPTYSGPAWGRGTWERSGDLGGGPDCVRPLTRLRVEAGVPTIRDFRDLRVYRAAYDGAMRVFEVSRRFPEEERFGLISQARRSSRSVAANVAEAWRKRRYPAAFVAKLSDAETEAAETRVHLDFALGCGYLDRREYLLLDRHYERITRQLVRMISDPGRWTPGRASGRSAAGPGVSPALPPPRAEKAMVEEAPPPTPARDPTPGRPKEARKGEDARRASRP